MVIDWHVSSEKSTIDSSGTLHIGEREDAERVFAWAEETDPATGDKKYAYAMIKNENPYVEDLRIVASADHAIVLMPVIIRHNSKASREHLHWQHTGVGAGTTMDYLTDIPDSPDYTAMRLIVGNDETVESITITLRVDGVAQPASISLPITRVDVVVSPTEVIARKGGDPVTIESNVSTADGAVWGHEDTTDTAYSEPDDRHYRIAIGPAETEKQIRVWRELGGKRAYANLLVDPAVVIIPDLLQVVPGKSYQLQQPLPGDESDFNWAVVGATDSEIKQESASKATLRVGDREASNTFKVTLAAYGQTAECLVSVSPSGDPLAVEPVHSEVTPGTNIKFTANKACDWSVTGATDPEYTMLDVTHGETATLIVSDNENANILTVIASTGLERVQASVTILRRITIEDIPPIKQGDVYTIVSDPPASMLDWEIDPKPMHPATTYIAGGVMYVDPSELEADEDYRSLRITASQEGYTSASTQVVVVRPLIVTPSLTTATPGETVIFTANAKNGLKWELAGAAHQDTRARPDPDNPDKCAVIISPSEPAYTEDGDARHLTLMVANQYLDTDATITLYDSVRIIDRSVTLSAGASYQFRSEPAPVELAWDVSPRDYAAISAGYLTVSTSCPAGTTLTITASKTSGVSDTVTVTVIAGLQLIAYDKHDQPITDGSQAVAPGDSIKIVHTSTYPSSQLTWTITGKKSTNTSIVSQSAQNVRMYASVDEYGDHTYHVTATEPGAGGRSASIDIAAEHLAIAAAVDTVYPGDCIDILPNHQIPADIAYWTVEGASSTRTRVSPAQGASTVLTVSRSDMATELRVILTMQWIDKYPDADPAIERVVGTLEIDQGVSIWPTDIDIERGQTTNPFDVRPSISAVKWTLNGGKYSGTQVIDNCFIAVDEREPVDTLLRITITGHDGKTGTATARVVDSRPYQLIPSTSYDNAPGTTVGIAAVGLDPDPAKYAWALEWIDSNSDTRIEYPAGDDKRRIDVVIGDHDYNRKFCVALRHDDIPDTLRCYITTTPAPKTGGLSTGKKVGIAVGSLVGIGVIGGGIAYGLNRLMPAKRKNGISATEETKGDHVDALIEMANTEIKDSEKKEEQQQEEDDNTSLLSQSFGGTELQLPRNSVDLRSNTSKQGQKINRDLADSNSIDDLIMDDPKPAAKKRGLLSEKFSNNVDEITNIQVNASIVANTKLPLNQGTRPGRTRRRDQLLETSDIDDNEIEEANNLIGDNLDNSDLVSHVEIPTGIANKTEATEAEIAETNLNIKLHRQAINNAICRCEAMCNAYYRLRRHINHNYTDKKLGKEYDPFKQLAEMQQKIDKNYRPPQFNLMTGREQDKLYNSLEKFPDSRRNEYIEQLGSEEAVAKWVSLRKQFMELVRLFNQIYRECTAQNKYLAALKDAQIYWDDPARANEKNEFGGDYPEIMRAKIKSQAIQFQAQWNTAWANSESKYDNRILPGLTIFTIADVEERGDGDQAGLVPIKRDAIITPASGKDVIVQAWTPIPDDDIEVDKDFTFKWDIFTPEGTAHDPETRIEVYKPDKYKYNTAARIVLGSHENAETITIQLSYGVETSVWKPHRIYRTYAIYNISETHGVHISGASTQRIMYPGSTYEWPVRNADNSPPMHIVISPSPDWRDVHPTGDPFVVSLETENFGGDLYDLIKDYDVGELSPTQFKRMKISNIKLTPVYDDDNTVYGPVAVGLYIDGTDTLIQGFMCLIPAIKFTDAKKITEKHLAPDESEMWLKYGEPVYLNIRELPHLQGNLNWNISWEQYFVPHVNIRFPTLQEEQEHDCVLVLEPPAEGKDANGTFTLTYTYQKGIFANSKLTKTLKIHLSSIGVPDDFDIHWDEEDPIQLQAKNTQNIELAIGGDNVFELTLKSPLIKAVFVPDRMNPLNNPARGTSVKILNGGQGEPSYLQIRIGEPQSPKSVLTLMLSLMGVKRKYTITCTSVKREMVIVRPYGGGSNIYKGVKYRFKALNCRGHENQLNWSVSPAGAAEFEIVHPWWWFLSRSHEFIDFWLKTNNYAEVLLTCSVPGEETKAIYRIHTIKWAFDTPNITMLPGQRHTYRVILSQGAVNMIDFHFSWSISTHSDMGTRLWYDSTHDTKSSRAIFRLGKQEKVTTIEIECDILDAKGVIVDTIKTTVRNAVGTIEVLGDLSKQPEEIDSMVNNAPAIHVSRCNGVKTVWCNIWDVMRDTGMRIHNYDMYVSMHEHIEQVKQVGKRIFSFGWIRNEPRALLYDPANRTYRYMGYAIGPDPQPDMYSDVYIEIGYPTDDDDNETITYRINLIRAYLISPAFPAPEMSNGVAPWYMLETATIGTLHPTPQVPKLASTACNPTDPTTTVIHIPRDPRDVATAASGNYVQQMGADASIGTWGGGLLAYISTLMDNAAVVQPMLAMETITSTISSSITTNALSICPDKPVMYVDRSRLHRNIVIVPYCPDHPNVYAIIPTCVPVRGYTVSFNPVAIQSMDIQGYNDGRIDACLAGCETDACIDCIYIRALEPQTPEYGSVRIASMAATNTYYGWLFVSDCPDWGYWPSYYAPVGYQYIYEPKHHVMPGETIAITLHGIPRSSPDIRDTMRIEMLGDHADQRTSATCRMYAIASAYDWVITLTVGPAEMHSPLVARITHTNADTGDIARYIIVFGPSQAQSVGITDLSNLERREIECLAVHDTHGDGQYIYPTVTVDISGLYQHILLLGNTATISTDYEIAECNEIEGLTIDVAGKQITITAANDLPYDYVDEPLHIQFTDESVYDADVYIIRTYRADQEAAMISKRQLDWGATAEIAWDRDGTYRAADAQITSASDPTSACELYDDPATGTQMIRVHLGGRETYDPLVIQMRPESADPSDPPEYMYMLVGPDQYMPNHREVRRYFRDAPGTRPKVSYTAGKYKIPKSGRYYKW